MSSESPRPAGPGRVLETCLYVSDVEKARNFYGNVLGLQEHAYEPPRHIFFKLDGGMLLLFRSTETDATDGDLPPHGGSGSGHMAFAASSSEIDAWKAHLGANGVEVEQEVDWPNGARSVYFRDPDGNLLEFATPELWSLGE